MKYCLVILMLNLVAAVGLAQIEYQVSEDSLAETNPIQWSGSVAIGADAQILGMPGGNATINLERHLNSSVTKLQTGYFFNEHVATGNLGLSRFDEVFLQVRHEKTLQDSKWIGFLQADLDATEYFNRLLLNGGVGFRVYQSDKSELTFRAGAGYDFSKTANDFQFQFGGNWAFQLTNRFRIDGDVDYFLPIGDRQNHWVFNTVLIDLGVEFVINKSRNIAIRHFVISRFGDDYLAWIASHYGFALVARF